MQLYRGTRVMATNVDTPSMAAYTAARRGRQPCKVGRLWHYIWLSLYDTIGRYQVYNNESYIANYG